jgi:hypothetical protein
MKRAGRTSTRRQVARPSLEMLVPRCGALASPCTCASRCRRMICRRCRGLAYIQYVQPAGRSFEPQWESRLRSCMPRYGVRASVLAE